jgi:hypothetical protein
VEYIVNRVLLPARKRFRRVVARIRAGKPPKPRARKPRKQRPVKPKRKTIAEMEREVERESRTPLPRGWRRWARADRVRARAEARAAKELAARLRAAENRPVPVWRQLRMHLRGWLCAAAPSIYQYPHSAPSCANEMRRLLAEPEMRALLMQNRYVGDSLKRVCRGLLVDLSLLYPEPDEAAAPGGAGSEPLAPAADEGPAASMPASTAAPEKNHFFGAVRPSPTIASEDVRPSRAVVDVLPKCDSFAPG